MKLSFIIIDDRELDCFIAEKLIQKTGLSTNNRLFYDGSSGLDFIKTHTIPGAITIILLDIMMPIMDGFQFIEEFEQLSEEIRNSYKVIPITTSLDKGDISRISNYKSVVTVLQKPFTFEALMEAIERIPEH